MIENESFWKIIDSLQTKWNYLGHNIKGTEWQLLRMKYKSTPLGYKWILT